MDANTDTEEDEWAKLSIGEKLNELGFELKDKMSDSLFTADQKETLHGALDMLAGAISVGHTTLEKTVTSDDCGPCKEVTELWNELLKVE